MAKMSVVKQFVANLNAVGEAAIAEVERFYYGSTDYRVGYSCIVSFVGHPSNLYQIWWHSKDGYYLVKRIEVSRNGDRFHKLCDPAYEWKCSEEEFADTIRNTWNLEHRA